MMRALTRSRTTVDAEPAFFIHQNQTIMDSKTERDLLLVVVVLTAICLGIAITWNRYADKSNRMFTIERSSHGNWQKSLTSYPDTTIIDTVNIDGIITYNTTQYIRVIKK